MKDLKFICAQPDDTYYTWQVHAWLESLKEIGHLDKAIVLIYTPSFREKSDKWQKIVDLYPEAELLWNISKQMEQLIGQVGAVVKNTAGLTTTTTTTTVAP